MAHILIIDDDDKLREKIVHFFQNNNFQVSSLDKGDQILKNLSELNPDIIILDLMMPVLNGIEVSKIIRTKSNVPIIFLSASADEVDRIVGLEVGADDFVNKPINPKELLARVNAVLRRSDPQKDTNKNAPILFGNLTINLQKRTVAKNEEILNLTSAELKLLFFLLANKERVLTRDQILDGLKSESDENFDRSVDVRITRLRKKIEDDPTSPRYIKTVWGEGYIFSDDKING